MNWKHAFTSAIGKKLVMGFTGLFLILFLIVHCYVNALVFFPNGREQFEAAAHFMGSNPLVRTMEIGLFFFLFLHAIQGIMLEVQNRAKRPVKYKVSTHSDPKKVKWYSKTMGIMGVLVLLFLVVHLYHFWIPNRYQQTFTDLGEINLYDKMQAVFQNPVAVLVYVIGCIALAWHLAHGFWSAFHTVGLAVPKYTPLIKGLGYAFAIIVPLIFISMPISFYMGWLA